MNHLKYFESIIRGETFDDEDINVVEDLLTELDDLGLDTRLWGNRHNIFLKKLSQIDIEIYYQSKKDIEYDSNEKPILRLEEDSYFYNQTKATDEDGNNIIFNI